MTGIFQAHVPTADIQGPAASRMTSTSCVRGAGPKALTDTATIADTRTIRTD